MLPEIETMMMDTGTADVKFSIRTKKMYCEFDRSNFGNYAIAVNQFSFDPFTGHSWKDFVML